MDSDNTLFLVFGATGRQGGSVARALLKQGRKVRALVRDTAGPPARALRDAGAEPVTGSFEDADSLRRALEGVSGVFSVLPAGLTAEDEIRLGVTIAEAAAESAVGHLIYSSGASVGDRPTGVARFDAKPHIEARIRQLPIAVTILRPTIFMDMMVQPGQGLSSGRLISLIRPENAIQLIATDDIGRFAAAAFADKARFAGVTMRIASDRVTGLDIQAIVSELAGRRISYERMADEVLDANADLAHMAWSLEEGPLAEPVDLEAMRVINPDLLTFRAWLATRGRQALMDAFAAQTG